MFQTILVVVVDRVWTRPDQAHVTTKDIPKLRELVEAVLAKDFPDTGDSGVAGYFENCAVTLVKVAQGIFQGIGVLNHGAEFVTIKVFPFLPYAAATVEG